MSVTTIAEESVHESGNNNDVNEWPKKSALTTINDVRLHYEVRGNGMHPVICIPGGLGTAKTNFGPQLEYFGREESGFKIVSFDPRGYGASRPAERFDKNYYESDAKDANALMHSLSLPKFSFMGWCGGGVAAIYLAAMYPENVRRMVIWGAKAFLRKEDIAIYDKKRDILNWDAGWRDTYLKIYGPSLQDLWIQIIDANTKRFDEGGDICMGELGQIKCPTLIMHGANDYFTSSLHAHYLHEHVAGSQLEVIEEGKHGFHLKSSKEFNKIVEEFLE